MSVRFLPKADISQQWTMTRTLFLLAVFLTGCASASPDAGSSVGEHVVIAKLDELRGMKFGCGGIAAYGAATYTVVEGPLFLSGRQINVLIYCLDESNYGSTNFAIGQRYRLHLTKVEPSPSDVVDQRLPPNPYAFYVRGDPEPMPQ